MAVIANSLSSHTGSISVQRPEESHSPMYWVARAGSMALAFIGTGFGALSYFPGKWANTMESEAQHDSLAQHFSEQIGARFGIHPSEVTREHLYELSTKDIAFAKLLESSMNGLQNANRQEKVVAGVSAFLPPGLGLLPNLGATVAASGTVSLFDKDKLTVVAATDHIEAKLADGALVTADDLMLLRVAQNDKLAEEIKTSYGNQFHKLGAEKRMEILETMPSLFDSVMRDSTALNNGLVKTQDLALQHAPTEAKWSSNAQARGQQVAKQGGFRAKLNADRAAAIAAKQQTQM